jgi:hypothetical protein
VAAFAVVLGERGGRVADVGDELAHAGSRAQRQVGGRAIADRTDAEQDLLAVDVDVYDEPVVDRDAGGGASWRRRSRRS